MGRRRGSVQHAVLLVLAITAFVGLLMVTVIRQAIRRGLTPLTSLAKVVERYDPMVPDTAPRSSQWAELAPMATSITDLGQRLARRIVSERAINAHAAHALRTPLAGIDAQLAVAQKIAPAELRPWLSRARAAAHRLIRVMQSLLTMHRTGSDVRRQSVRLSELVALWSSDEVKVEIRGLREVMADPDLLAAVLSNLLDNAREHGAKDVRIRTQLSDLGWYRLQVIDNGRGCPTHVHEQLRAAFGRHDYHLKAGSSGLGLILANLVMNAHGGLVRLPYTARGFCVELAWPSANPQRSHD
jgi:two-component system OmpR family sensor kinase